MWLKPILSKGEEAGLLYSQDLYKKQTHSFPPSDRRGGLLYSRPASWRLGTGLQLQRSAYPPSHIYRTFIHSLLRSLTYKFTGHLFILSFLPSHSDRTCIHCLLSHSQLNRKFIHSFLPSLIFTHRTYALRSSPSLSRICAGHLFIFSFPPSH